MSPSAAFHHRLLRLFSAWLLLVALMLASLGSAYLPLGSWNVAIGLAIAALKAAIVAIAFMHLARAATLARIAMGAAAFTLALMFGLSEVDYATRAAQSASVQAPQQLRPLRQGGTFR